MEARRELERHWFSRAGLARMPLMQAEMCQPGSLPLCPHPQFGAIRGAWWPSSNTIPRENLGLEFLPGFAFSGSFSLHDILYPFFHSKVLAV